MILNFLGGRRQQRTDTGHVTIMEDRVLVDHKIMITLISNQGQSLEHDVKAPLFGLLLFQSGSHHAKNMCADIVDIPSIPITRLVTAVCTRIAALHGQLQ